MLSYLLVVALGLSLAAPFVRAWFWSVPFGLLSVGMVLRSVLGTALTTAVAGALAVGCLGWAPSLSPEQAGAYGASVGGAVGFALLLVSVSRKRHLRGALLLAHRLREPEVRETAHAALRSVVDRLRPKDDEARMDRVASVVLLVVPPMTSAGMWKEAEELLAWLEPTRLTARHRALRGQALSACRLERGDVEGARDALASVSRPVDDEALEAWLATTDALVSSVSGAPDEALAIVGEDASADDPLLRGSRRIARAHAFAAKGEPERAEAELEALREEVGEEGLHRAVTPNGPATGIARRLMRGS